MTSQETPLKIAIVVGEHSGDILGSSLIASFKKRYPNAEFVGIAGPRMIQQGAKSWFSMDELAVMGLVEILGSLPRLFKLRGELITKILDWQPDIFIGIDAPEFNTGLELKLKKQGIKTIHYVSPSVWAWRQRRIFKIKKATDRVLALLPFEKKFYDKFDVPCDFVGHPLADEIPLDIDRNAAKEALGLSPEQQLFVIMPGSRRGEIAQLVEPFLKAAELVKASYPDVKIIIPMVDERRKVQLQDLLETLSFDVDFEISVGNARECMMAADTTLMASGTASLEAMLCKTPMTIGYRVHRLTYEIASRLVSVKYAGLPNLLSPEPIISEFIQDDMTPEALANDVCRLLAGKNEDLIKQFNALHLLIKRDASERACDAIVEVLND